MRGSWSNLLTLRYSGCLLWACFYIQAERSEQSLVKLQLPNARCLLEIIVTCSRKQGSAEVTDVEPGLVPKSDDPCKGWGVGLTARDGGVLHAHLPGGTHTDSVLQQPNDITRRGCFQQSSLFRVVLGWGRTAHWHQALPQGSCLWSDKSLPLPPHAG